MSITIYYIHVAEYLLTNAKNISFRKNAFKYHIRHSFYSNHTVVAQIQNFWHHTTLYEG